MKVVGDTNSNNEKDVVVLEKEICPKPAALVQKQNRHRKLLVVFSMAITFFYYGALFGWGPMQLLLEENGSFSFKCNKDDTIDDNDDVCPAQTSALVNVQLYAMVTQLVTPLIGEIADRFGAVTLSYFMTSCYVTGTGLLIVAAEWDDYLFYAAFIFIGLGTWAGNILNTLCGMNYGGDSQSTQSRIIFILNALWDSGSITYLGLYEIADATNASLTVIMIGYFCAALILFPGTSLLWRITKPLMEEGEEGDDAKGKEPEAPPADKMESFDIPQKVVQSDSMDPIMLLVDREEHQSQNGTRVDDKSNHVNNDVATIELNPKSEQVEENDDVVGDKNDSPTATSSYVIIANRTPKQQLLSKPLRLLLLFFTIHATANQWHMTTTRDFLAFLGDDDYNNKYLKIFTLLMPASLCALPFVDTIVLKFGFHGGFQGVNAFAVGYSLVRLLSINLNVQIFGFILFSFYRSFLFSVSFSFVPTIMAPNVVGKANGILVMAVGITSWLNVPLADFTIEDQDGDFFLANLLYTILIMPCISAAWGIGSGIEQEREAKEKKQQTNQGESR